MAGVCVWARYEDYEAFKETLKSLKEARVRRYRAYGPTNLEEVEDLMPSEFSAVRGCSTFGAVIGLATFFLMCVISSLIYNLVVGGKPPVSNVPYVIPAYEGTILLGGMAAFLGVLLFAALWPRHLPSEYDPRFSLDSFGIVVQCGFGEKRRVMSIIEESGAVEVRS